MAMGESLVLTGARIAQGPRRAVRVDLEIQGSKIVACRHSGPSAPRGQRFELDLRDCLILPGLINAHDHLEFSLFPRLGRGPYSNAGEWARDIYHPDRPPIREHLRIPLATRLRWGGIKNLLSGVTTVCHHNPYYPRIFDKAFPVRVPRVGWAHSLEFTRDVASCFRKTPSRWPFILHLGEATDHRGQREIFSLDAMGALDRRTVLVHAVALRGKGLNLSRKRGSSVIWCPSSNLFILGRTLSQAALRHRAHLALGTDSALSGKGDLLDELRVARRAAGLSVDRLYRMVTEDAARVLRLNEGEGTISEGGIADLLVVRKQGRNPAETLFKLKTADVEMVLVGGIVKLISPRLAARFPSAIRRRFHPITVQERQTVLLDAGLPGIYRQATRVLGSDIRLAGKKVRVSE